MYRNIKKQYPKLLKSLQAYAVMATHVKLNVYNTQSSSSQVS